MVEYVIEMKIHLEIYVDFFFYRNSTIDNINIKKTLKSSTAVKTKYCKNMSPLKVSHCGKLAVKTLNIEMELPTIPYLMIDRSTSSLCNLTVKNICFLEVITTDDRESIAFPVNKIFDGSDCDKKPQIDIVDRAVIYFVGYNQLTSKLPFVVKEHLELSSLLFRNVSKEKLSEVEKYLIETPGKLEIKTSCDCHSLWLLRVFHVRANQRYTGKDDNLIFCQGIKLEKDNLFKRVLIYYNDIEPEKPLDPIEEFAWLLAKKINSVKNIDFIRSNCTDLYRLYNNATRSNLNTLIVFVIIFLTIYEIKKIFII